MNRPKLCLTLTGKTLEENLLTVKKYADYIDMLELRADFLAPGEHAGIGSFGARAGFPCLLTIRRRCDGGLFDQSESERASLFRTIFSGPDVHFDFVDFEEDFHVADVEQLAHDRDARIIRSVHSFDRPVLDIAARVRSLQNGTEIPKIAFMPGSLDDVTNLFVQAAALEGEHILLAMGPLGVPSRILAAKLGNFLTFASPADADSAIGNLAHLDPKTLCETYHFKEIDGNTRLYGITGFPLAATSSPALHNGGYKKHGLNAVYVPVRVEEVSQAVSFAETAGITGLSVTIPHKEKVIPLLTEQSPEVTEIGACNTIVKKADGWHGHNTDAPGFTKSLLEFTGTKNVEGKKVAVIGAGGAACAVVYALKKLGAHICIFNRTEGRAHSLAQKFGCNSAALNEDSLALLAEYSQIIVQTTSKGMNSTEPANPDNDPIYFYDFLGDELLFDIVYVPEVTPVMARARKAGCKVINGYDMLRYQGHEQFRLFTGVPYE